MSIASLTDGAIQPKLVVTAWAAALPDSPFEDFDSYGGWFAPIVLSTTTALLPLIAAAVGKRAPTYQQTQ